MNNSVAMPQSAVNKPNVSDNAMKLIDWMFRRLKSISPAWKQAFDSVETYNETKLVWLEELLKAGVVTPQALKRGLDEAAKSKSPFFPSVGQFVAWCRIQDYHELGLPNLDELEPRFNRFLGFAKFDTHKFQYRSKAEYYLLRTLYLRYGKKSHDDMLKAMPKLLAETADKVRSGFEFDDIPKMIPAKPSFYDKARADKARESAMAMMRAVQ